MQQRACPSQGILLGLHNHSPSECELSADLSLFPVLFIHVLCLEPRNVYIESPDVSLLRAGPLVPVQCPSSVEEWPPSADHMSSRKACCSCQFFSFVCYCLSPFSTDVFICGGYNGEVILGDIWKLNLQTFQWVKLPATMPEPVYFHCAAVTPVSFVLCHSYTGDGKEDQQGEEMLILTNFRLRKGEKSTVTTKFKRALKM